MAEYIEREKAKAYLIGDYAYAAAKVIDEVPSADVVEVVHGEWMVNISPVEVEFRCSKCNYSYIEADPNQNCDYNYCPICGAKMDANSKTSLPEATRQTVLDSFMKGSED